VSQHWLALAGRVDLVSRMNISPYSFFEWFQEIALKYESFIYVIGMPIVSGLIIGLITGHILSSRSEFAALKRRAYFAAQNYIIRLNDKDPSPVSRIKKPGFNTFPDESFIPRVPAPFGESWRDFKLSGYDAIASQLCAADRDFIALYRERQTERFGTLSPGFLSFNQASECMALAEQIMESNAEAFLQLALRLKITARKRTNPGVTWYDIKEEFSHDFKGKNYRESLSEDIVV
jgi:hypothetical protein